jgi:hypothetical protein
MSDQKKEEGEEERGRREPRRREGEEERSDISYFLPVQTAGPVRKAWPISKYLPKH